MITVLISLAIVEAVVIYFMGKGLYVAANTIVKLEETNGKQKR